MYILFASAFHGCAIQFPVWNTHSIRPILLYTFRGDATLTIAWALWLWSTGTCIINYAPPQINVLVMALGIVWLFVTMSTLINAASQSTAWFLHNQRRIQQQMPPDRIDVIFNSLVKFNLPWWQSMELDARRMNTALQLRCRVVFMCRVSRSICCSCENPNPVTSLYVEAFCWMMRNCGYVN